MNLLSANGRGSTPITRLPAILTRTDGTKVTANQGLLKKEMNLKNLKMCLILVPPGLKVTNVQ